MTNFKLTTDMTPKGDQPQAIEELAEGLKVGKKYQTLLGVTGSGKTFTLANVIARFGRPTLVISHNKTLAAQLYGEFKEFFKGNAVHYFVSYYDYYQPEAYIPQKDIYIEKDASINEEIDRLRLAATSALMARQDVIIVASVSCIYGLGSPEDYEQMVTRVYRGQKTSRKEILSKLVAIQYERTTADLARGRFRARGDVIEVLPAYEQVAYHVELFGDQVDRLCIVNPTTGQTISEEEQLVVYPARHFVAPEGRVQSALEGIEAELEERLEQFRSQGKLLEAQRLEARTRYDIEMLQEVGYCTGVENYSRHLSGRLPGERPYTLIDYFPRDFLCLVDESHVSIPQIRGMYAGDMSRKGTLVEHGFRLPSALDNRPMRFAEWEASTNQVIFVSATPGPYELEKCKGEVVEQVIRPTGLVDPPIEVQPASGQVPHLVEQVRAHAERKERVLVTTLTKRLAEDLADYIKEQGISCRYLHSEIDTIERVEILRDLRLGKFDCLVGINLLREGLDLPEVSMVAILDADKEGFLRSETSLIQTIGRTARNVKGKVILYADRITNSMRRAIDETARRRKLQVKYNKKHHITPATVQKAIRDGIESEISHRKAVREQVDLSEEEYVTEELLQELEKEMYRAAGELDFEEAARIRDRIQTLAPARHPRTRTPAYTRRRSKRRRRH